MAALPDLSEWQQATEENVYDIKGAMCPNCFGSNARSTVLPTKIPMFREIILMNVICEDCNFKNCEVTFGGEIQKMGARTSLQLTKIDDLNRQLIKSDSCSLLIPELEFEIPTKTQRGVISTIEGFLSKASKGLEAGQADRLRLGDVDNFYRCKKVMDSLNSVLSGDSSNITLILDDPAGNSFVENLNAPEPDPELTTINYNRTPMQDMSLGLQPSDVAREEGKIDDEDPAHKNLVNGPPTGLCTLEMDKPEQVGREEAIKFSTPCPNCFKQTETNMCVTDIPHFKEVIIMSLFCDHCGYKSNEIKGGGAIPQYGTKIAIQVTSPEDLQREVLKSDSAGIDIPELELSLCEGGLDGLYTTVEGLLNKMFDRLTCANPFGTGDSATQHHLTNDAGESGFSQPTHVKFSSFLQELKNMSLGNSLPFTLVITDPLSNSFVGPTPEDAVRLSLQAEKDGNNDCFKEFIDLAMKIEEFERTEDQNEILGLSDMKTENYQQEDAPNHTESRVNHGTDKPRLLPDRLRKIDVRGPDHPVAVAKGTTEGDTTVMGEKSDNFAVPGIEKRGSLNTDKANGEKEETNLMQQRNLIEKGDSNFLKSVEFTGSVEGMVFKNGAQGLGYYTDGNTLQ